MSKYATCTAVIYPLQVHVSEMYLKNYLKNKLFQILANVFVFALKHLTFRVSKIHFTFEDLC